MGDARMWFRKWRIWLGSRILGTEYVLVTFRLWEVYRRAKDCITPEGQVILAECKPLSDALYAEMPGSWTFTMTRHFSQDDPSAVGPTGRDR